MSRLREPLSRHIPDGTVDFVVDLLKGQHILIQVVNHRKTKIGDFRPSHSPLKPHKITINHDLTPDAFLMILLHEIAHLNIWLRYQHKVPAHGQEWKSEYSGILSGLLQKCMISDQLKEIILSELESGIKATMKNHDFNRIMSKASLDKPSVLVADIPEGTIFILEDGKTYKKGIKLRSRYRCVCINNRKNYLVAAAARVTRIIDGDKELKPILQ